LKKNFDLKKHENAAVFLDAFSGTDFTVNAVYYDITRKTLSDPLGVAFKDYRTSTLRLSNSLDKANKLETFRSSLIRMIRLSVEMNFKIDPELLDIAKDNESVRKTFSEYSLQKPDKVFYNLH